MGDPVTDRPLTRRQAGALQVLLTRGPVLGVYPAGLISTAADSRRVLDALAARGLAGVYRGKRGGLRSWLATDAGAVALAASAFAAVDLLAGMAIGPWAGMPAQPRTLERALSLTAA